MSAYFGVFSVFHGCSASSANVQQFVGYQTYFGFDISVLTLQHVEEVALTSDWSVNSFYNGYP